MKALAGIATMLFAIGFFIYFIMTFGWVKLDASQVGVRKHLSKGVIEEVYPAGTANQYNNFWWDVYAANIGIQKITFDNNGLNDAEYPRIPVEIGENGGQQAWISLTVNYVLEQEKIVELFRQGMGETYENVLLKREITDVVNEIARPYESALIIKSGVGFVKFKQRVEEALQANTELKKLGIKVINVVLYGVHLDPLYEAEITGKQIAIQQRLRKEQEKLAAEEEAKKVFAQSEAKVQSALQEANAEKNKMVTAATAKKEADLQEAEGIIAKGKAEAEVIALKSAAMYAGEAGSWRAKVSMKKLEAENLKGMLAGVSVITDRALVNLGRSAGIFTSADYELSEKK